MLPAQTPRTVVVVDDHAPFREFARIFLVASGYRVLGEAADGAGALAQVARLQPDVVLLDVQLPDIDGFEVARRITARPGGPAVLLTSTRDRSDYGGRIRSCGAIGFLPKSELSGAAIRRLLG